MPQVVELRRFPSPARPLDKAGRVPAMPATDQVYVMFTSIDDTLRAVGVASRLARALRARITVVHLRPVAFGAPLESPCGISPAESEDFTERLQAIACEATVRVYLCRDARQALPMAFRNHSLVLIGARRRWWPTAADRWRRALEAAGHLVLLVSDRTAREVAEGR